MFPERPCASHVPPGDRVIVLKADQVAFGPPEGVAPPGKNPVHGLAVYNLGNTGMPGEYEVTCALPDAERAVCTTILDEWLRMPTLLK